MYDLKRDTSKDTRMIQAPDFKKPDYTYLDELVHALEATVQVLQWSVEGAGLGRSKGDFMNVPPDKFRAAMYRHMAEIQKASAFIPDLQLRDPESGALHLAHAAANALILLEMAILEAE